jgi:hypothetical protein
MPSCNSSMRRLQVCCPTERERINELYRQGTLKDEARRRLERGLDLREALVGHQQER